MNLIDSITNKPTESKPDESKPADNSPGIASQPATVIDAPPVNAPVESAAPVIEQAQAQSPVAAVESQPAQPANIAQLVDPPKALPTGKGKGNRKLSDYYKLDWNKSNSDLAKEAGVSRQRIAQIREAIEEKKKAGVDLSASDTVESEIPGITTETEQPAQPAQPTEPAIVKAAVDYRLLAETTFDMGTGLLCMTIGPEWKPRQMEVNGQIVDERAIVCDALQKYYTAKQVQDLPPGVLLAFVLVSYSAPRFAEPNTSSKVKLAWQWAKVKVGKLFKRKNKPQQLEIVK